MTIMEEKFNFHFNNLYVLSNTFVRTLYPYNNF